MTFIYSHETLCTHYRNIEQHAYEFFSHSEWYLSKYLMWKMFVFLCLFTFHMILSKKLFETDFLTFAFYFIKLWFTIMDSAVIAKNNMKIWIFEKIYTCFSFVTISLIDFIEPLIKLARAVGRIKGI